MTDQIPIQWLTGVLRHQLSQNDIKHIDLSMGVYFGQRLEVSLTETLEANAKLREAVEALSKELTTEAASMMRQPEAGVIRSIAERLHSGVFRRKWRDKP